MNIEDMPTSLDPYFYAQTQYLEKLDDIIKQIISKYDWKRTLTPTIIEYLENSEILLTPEQPTNSEEWMELLK